MKIVVAQAVGSQRIDVRCLDQPAIATDLRIANVIEQDVRRDIGGDEQIKVSGIRASDISGADTFVSSDSITLLVGGSSVELASTGTTIQGMNISSVAKAQNVVSGAMVQLNPPGFMVPPAQGSTFLKPEDKDTSWSGRENPKPTERVKVTRDDGPKS